MTLQRVPPPSRRQESHSHNPKPSHVRATHRPASPHAGLRLDYVAAGHGVTRVRRATCHTSSASSTPSSRASECWIARSRSATTRASRASHRLTRAIGPSAAWPTRPSTPRSLKSSTRVGRAMRTLMTCPPPPPLTHAYHLCLPLSFLNPQHAPHRLVHLHALDLPLHAAGIPAVSTFSTSRPTIEIWPPPPWQPPSQRGTTTRRLAADIVPSR